MVGFFLTNFDLFVIFCDLCFKSFYKNLPIKGLKGQRKFEKCWNFLKNNAQLSTKRYVIRF